MADYRIEMINGFPVIIDNNINFKNSITALHSPCDECHLKNNKLSIDCKKNCIDYAIWKNSEIKEIENNG